MLQRVRLTDFKSFVDEEVTLAPLTILLGANASGKSNFLDAFRFLQQTIFDLTFADILDGERSRSGWQGIRGGASEAARLGTSVFAIESTWRLPDLEEWEAVKELPPSDQWVELTHRLACRTAPKTQLEAESLGRGRQEGSLYRTGAVREDEIEVPWPKRPWNGTQPGASTTWLSRDQTLAWTVLGSINPGSPRVPSEVADYTSILSEGLKYLRFPSPEPARMRTYGRRDSSLQDDGSNLSGVLADLCADPTEKRSLVDWLSELCAPEIADIDFIEVPELRDVMAVLVEKSGKRISARSLSDGTLRFLGLLLSLRTAPPGSVVFLEDIESHLHPTRIKLLVEYLDAVTRTRGVQVIATTHSPVVLSWLTKEALGDAIVFGRIPEREGTVMHRLADLPHFEEVSKLKGADELFSTGWLEMAL